MVSAFRRSSRNLPAMSGGGTEEVVKSAVPVADLTLLDKALRGDAESLRAALKKLRPADLGRDLSRRSVGVGCRILAGLDDRSGSAALRAAHPSVAANLLAKLDLARAGRTIAFMPTDHQVAILSVLDAKDRGRIEGALSEEERTTLNRMMAFPEHAVGRLMTPKVWRCEVDQTIAAAMAVLADHATEIEVAQNLYVTEKGKLIGVVALRELSVLLTQGKGAESIEPHMTRDVIALSEDTDRKDAAEIIQTHDFLSLPVIDKAGALVGAVRVDDLLDAALSRTGAGLLNQGGVAGKIAGAVPYFQTSMFRVVRSRITWLILLFVAETATGTVLRHFEDELAKAVALAFFIPLLIGTGGNAGSQTVSTIIRALALGEVRPNDVGRVIMREATAGFILGILLGVIAFFRALMWGVHADLALCVATTILVVCTWANTVGAAIPLGAQKAKIDPTVISGPLITTLVDASGLFLYLTIAKIMIAELRH
jgi:magnesium transporter